MTDRENMIWAVAFVTELRELGIHTNTSEAAKLAAYAANEVVDRYDDLTDRYPELFEDESND